MKFPKNNHIPYMQDFRVFEGVPNDIEFEIVKLDEVGETVKLVAPGYGGIPYGNGALILYRNWSKS